MSKEKDNYKRWCIATVLIMSIGLALIALLVAVVDPYWHFHGPVEGISYRLGNGRYMNDGILKNYDYDAVIIGTSMSENFKPSQWNESTGETTVKTPFFGATFKEIHDTLERAYVKKADIQTVIWGLDYNQLTNDWGNNKYDNYPEYLYDDSILNDGNYLWNKTVLLRGVLPDIAYTMLGRPSADFDDYGSWEDPSGKEAVLSYFTPGQGIADQKSATAEVMQTAEGNVTHNIEEIVKNHPETQFYFFFTPYSIAYWDSTYHSGNINVQIEATRIFAEHLLPYANVKLYCFYDNTDMICDLDNYVDAGHYKGEINDRILQWMIDGEYQWTEENYEEKLEEMRRFYGGFDYGAYWE